MNSSESLLVTFLLFQRRHSRWVVWLTIFAVLGWYRAAVSSVQLPVGNDLERRLTEFPVQSVSSAPDFNFEWHGKRYEVFPRADYMIRGLVVSHNNPEGWGDIYHDSTSVDIRDLCLIWGDNVKGGIAREMSFWSEPWTCMFRPHSDRARAQFDGEALSNNHILAGTAEIARTVRGIERGDQVELSGYLADYQPAGQPDYVRRTSLVRTDTGNGACEVLFVTTARVLVSANEGARWWRATCKDATILGVVLFLLSMTLFPYLEYKFI